MNFLERLKQLIYPSAGAGVHAATGTRWVRAGTRDAARDIERRGGMQATEIASICLRWRATQVAQPYMAVQHLSRTGAWHRSNDNDLFKLLLFPNKDRTMREMLSCTDISLGLHGNAYWIKERGEQGRVVALKWVPSTMMRPFWKKKSKDFITGYAYTPDGDGNTYLFYPEDVLHFRDVVDIGNIRYGYPPLKPLLNSIGADISMTEYEDAIMRNMGIPGAVFIPKPEFAMSVTDVQAHDIKKRYKETTSGEARGEPLVLDYPADVVFPNVTPSNMSIEVMRKSPETRIPAALGLNAVAVGLDMTQTGLNTSKKELIRQAWDYGVSPIHDIITDTLNKALVPEFFNPQRYRAVFVYDDVPFLREDETELHERIANDWKSGFITLDEARAATRYTKDVTGRGGMYYNEFISLQSGDNNQQPKEKEGGEDADEKPEKNDA